MQKRSDTFKTHVYIVLTTALALLFLTSCGPQGPSIPSSTSPHADIALKSDSIYGKDNRKSICEVSHQYRNLAKGIAMIVLDEQLLPHENATDSFTLKKQTLAQSKIFQSPQYRDYPLCDSVRFRDEVNPANCSGFLVGPDLVMTAGHCIPSPVRIRLNKNQNGQGDFKTDKIRFLFNVTNLDEEGHCQPQGKSVFKKQEIYSLKKVVKFKSIGQERGDYALVQLDRPVKNGTVLTLDKEKRTHMGDHLLLVGHPSGLLMKFADDAQVLSEDIFTFNANLDAFQGNSGSAVFNLDLTDENHLPMVAGILVSGRGDFRLNAEKKCVEESTYTQFPENSAPSAASTATSETTATTAASEEEKEKEEEHRKLEQKMESITIMQQVFAEPTAQQELFDYLAEVKHFTQSLSRINQTQAMIARRGISVPPEMMAQLLERKTAITQALDHLSNKDQEFFELSHLLQSGAQLDAFDERGEKNSLIFAIESGDVSLMQHLLKLGANPFVENKNGLSAAKIIQKLNHPRLNEIFFSKKDL